MLSKEECIEKLVELSSTNENGKVITRDFFRKNTGIIDVEWIEHFGTFAEFRRAAGLFPTRHEMGIQNNIAKHASTDNYKSLNSEKRMWEGKYLRPSKSRFQSIVIASDIHDIQCCPFYMRLFLDSLNRIKPEIIVLNGDIFDLPEFSHYTTDPRNYDVVGRIKFVHNFLENIRKASPESQIDFIEGNHEFRLLRHLSEAAPGLRTILSDLHGFTIPDLLGLTKFEVNFYARADLAAFNQNNVNTELQKNYIIYNDQVLFHHFPQAKSWGYPGSSAHHHKFVIWNDFSPRFGSFSWIQSGCGHKRNADYTEGKKWQNGFIIAHLDMVKQKTQFEIIDTTADHCFIGGKFYQRKEEEIDFS